MRNVIYYIHIYIQANLKQMLFNTWNWIQNYQFRCDFNIPCNIPPCGCEGVDIMSPLDVLSKTAIKTYNNIVI